MQTKLTQKVDHFTMFESFPSCSQKFPPNFGWLDMRGSIRDDFIGWVVGVEVYSTKWWWGMYEAQKPAWKECAGSLMAEMKHVTIYTVDIWTAKTSNNTSYCQPRHLSVPFKPLTSP